MDRKIVYTGEVPLGADFLLAQRHTMTALGMALKAIIGTNTVVDGLNCTPTTPASMEVVVGPGSIHSLENLDGTAYGDLPSDTTHQIVKQGLSLDDVELLCPAPATTGHSINYLIQVNYQDQDTDSVVLPYFNAANPAVAFAGPANSGVSQNTTRKGACVISVKAGVSATTGTQTTPAPDAGFIGLWVVTVGNGATSINSGNISRYSGSGSATGATAFWSTPFLAEKLQDKVSIPTGDLRWQPIGGGTGRTKLTGDTTFYVATTGNDTTGDGTLGNPWLTGQKAYDYIAKNIDLAGFVATVQLANGAYTGAIVAYGPLVGSTKGAGSLVFQGNTGSPSSCFINVTSNSCFSAFEGARFTINGFKLAATGIHPAGNGALAQNPGSQINYLNIEFGACATSHVQGNQYGLVQASIGGTITITGGGGCHLRAGIGGMAYEAIGTTITLSGSLTFTEAFASTLVGGIIEARANTYSGGTVTGTRYSADTGVIDTNGGGGNYFPGNSGGVTANGGVYL